MSNEEQKDNELLPIKELGVEQLRFYCDKDRFDFDTTATVPPLEGMIGQERGVKAMEFGLHTPKPGYNIFVSGTVGTGKLTYAKQVVRKLAKNQPVPRDWCYVNNFDDNSQPIAISLPAGSGNVFRMKMKEMLENLRDEVPKAFNSEDYEQERTAIMKEFHQEQLARQEAFVEKAKSYAIQVNWSDRGFILVPLVNGETISDEEFQKLDEEQKDEIKANMQAVQYLAMAEMRKTQQHDRETKEKIRQLENSVALFAVGHPIDEVQEQFKDIPEVIDYLETVRLDVVKNIKDFRHSPAKEEENMTVMYGKTNQEILLERYSVNLLVDNRNCEGSPVIIETNPIYYNLCGRAEYSSRMGVVSTNFTMLKAGSFHLANGGYLIVNARDVLLNPGVWEAMKRTLKTKKLSIESLGEQFSLIAMASLNPHAIPVDIKVIMLGSPYIYYLMYQYDEDFRKLFKIHADFDVQMNNTEENVAKMAAFVSAITKKEELREVTRAAVANVVEYASRLSGSQTKFTARFNQIVDILCEADSWAAMEGADNIDTDHVQQAIAEKRYRANRFEERMQEMFKEGTYLIDTDGAEVGQINGLAVLGAGEHSFGKPSRITANTYLGRAGVINIERETKMSGATHSKGVLILSGYLGYKYAQRSPLSITASLTFEQLYDGVDGDSASSAELYAILSSLSELPLRQDLAVTGSVNQKGEIQPIGGVNEKIEGWFEVCKIKGLTGRQGVIIPQQNVKELQLVQEVVDSVAEGQFHIYTVASVDEGIELLTGVAAGKADGQGTYPEQSVHGLITAKLQTYHKAYSAGSNYKNGKDNKNDEDNDTGEEEVEDN